MEKFYPVKCKCLREQHVCDANRGVGNSAIMRCKARVKHKRCSSVKSQFRLFCSAQASFEYLLVIALTFVVIVPATYLFYDYSRESSQEIIDAQVTKIGRTIVDMSESIYYSGEGSKTVLDLNMPENV